MESVRVCGKHDCLSKLDHPESTKKQFQYPDPDRQFALIVSLNNWRPSQIYLPHDIDCAAHLHSRRWTCHTAFTAVAICLAVAY